MGAPYVGNFTLAAIQVLGITSEQMPRAGIVVLDTSTLKYFQDPERRENLLRDLSVAQWEVWPSVLNVLEVTKNENTRIRNDLLGTIRALSGGRPLLPWPHVLLKQAAETVIDHGEGFVAGDRSLDWLLADPDCLSQKDIDESKQFWRDRESTFTDTNAKGRRVFQPFLKERDLRNEWRDARDFLERQWSTRSHLDSYVESLWQHLDLKPPPLIDEVLATEIWRLFFDGHGVAAYERAIAQRPPRQVQEADVLQLMYLAGSRRRMIVSEDQGLLRAAGQVVRGRYDNAWVVNIADLLKQ
jgi:hypothetical protein